MIIPLYTLILLISVCFVFSKDISFMDIFEVNEIVWEELKLFGPPSTKEVSTI